jgi:dipeptidyl aminopeptidase/acylaminoacyl peptidase
LTPTQDHARANGGADSGVGARILYVSRWSGSQQIYALDPSGRAPLGKVGVGDDAIDVFAPFPAPDGGHLVYRSGLAVDDSPHVMWIARSDGSDARALVVPPASVEAAAWSPDSSRLAYIVHELSSTLQLRVVDADGSDDHRVLTPSSACGPILWSADSRHVHLGTCGAVYAPNRRWLAAARGSRLSVAPAAKPAAPSFVLHGWEPAWSPDSRLLAYLNAGGVNVLDTRTGKARLLVAGGASHLAWSPDGRTIAYLAVDAPLNADPIAPPADLRTVTLDGRVSVVVHADAPYGGVISDVTWTRTPTAAYPTPPVTAGVYADGNIDALAADGRRVVYAACSKLFSWTPSSGALSELPTVIHAPTYPGGSCVNDIYTIAAAGDRIAYGTIQGGNNRFWTLQALAGDGTTQSLGGGDAQYGAPTEGVLAGGDDTLAYTAGEAYEAGQSVQLFGGPTLAASRQNPPQPTLLDIDAHHLLVGRADDVEVFDLSSSDSTLLQLTIAGVPSGIPSYTLPADMQLAGQHVAIRNGDVLYDYDLTGRLQHTWPVASGARLQDGTTDLLAYTAGGELHLLRLTDGLDQTVAAASVARFMDTGLAYANGPHLKLIPVAQLPAH